MATPPSSGKKSSRVSHRLRMALAFEKGVDIISEELDSSPKDGKAAVATLLAAAAPVSAQAALLPSLSSREAEHVASSGVGQVPMSREDLDSLVQKGLLEPAHRDAVWRELQAKQNSPKTSPKTSPGGTKKRTPLSSGLTGSFAGSPARSPSRLDDIARPLTANLRGKAGVSTSSFQLLKLTEGALCAVFRHLSAPSLGLLQRACRGLSPGGAHSGQVRAAAELSVRNSLGQVVSNADVALFLSCALPSTGSSNGTQSDSPADPVRRMFHIEVWLAQRAAGNDRVSAGDAHSAVVTTGGSLSVFGGKRDPVTKTLQTSPIHILSSGLAGAPAATIIVQVAAAGSHTIALSLAGSVFTWGDGAHGRLGHGDGNNRVQPTRVSFDECGAAGSVVHVAAGSQHSLAVSITGALFTWGCGQYGALGHGTEEDCTVPTVVDHLLTGGGGGHTLLKEEEEEGASRGHVIVQAAAGAMHSLALDDCGNVFAFGAGDDGRLGTGSDGVGVDALLPVMLPSSAFRSPMGGSRSSSRVMQVEAGYAHSLAVSKDGLLFAWGWGETGCLGLGSQDSPCTPQLVPSFARGRRGGQGVRSVATGFQHTLILLDSSAVYVCGNAGPMLGLDDADGNEEGAGADEEEIRDTPVKIPCGAAISQVAAGDSHSLLLSADNEVYSCGQGWSGQLGHGETEDCGAPKKVEGAFMN